jgi:hypothetical protein
MQEVFEYAHRRVCGGHDQCMISKNSLEEKPVAFYICVTSARSDAFYTLPPKSANSFVDIIIYMLDILICEKRETIPNDCFLAAMYQMSMSLNDGDVHSYKELFQRHPNLRNILLLSSEVIGDLRMWSGPERFDMEDVFKACNDHYITDEEMVESGST